MLYKASFLGCQQNLLKNVVCCHICTASVAQSKATAKFARKFLLQNEGKKRQKWHDSRMVEDHNLSFVKCEDKGMKNTKRIQILNKVFLNKIAEIMSTGEVSAQLCGLSLEISEVRVLPNLQGINVHWLCPGTDNDAKIESVLLRNSKALRHELSQLRVLGHIPPITFVKDNSFWKLQKVERLLSVADFGEDYEASSPTHHLKSSHLLNTTVDYDKDVGPISKVKIESDDPFAELFKASMYDLPLSDDIETDELPPDLPFMRYDVLGVDTQNIYTKVLQRLKKTQADHRKNIEKQTFSSSQWDSDTCTISSKPKEIQHWVSQYKLQHRKVSCQKKKEAFYNVPHHCVEDEEEIVYSEDDDYMED